MKLIVCCLAEEGSVKVCLSPSHPYDRVSTRNGLQAQLSCFPVVWCVPNQGSVVAANVFISVRSTGCGIRRRGWVGSGLYSLEEMAPESEQLPFKVCICIARQMFSGPLQNLQSGICKSLWMVIYFVNVYIGSNVFLDLCWYDVYILKSLFTANVI